MFRSSSKRAFSSTTAVTDLPASAASISAAMIGLSLAGAVERLLDRDDVGIGAAWRMNCTTTSKLS